MVSITWQHTSSRFAQFLAALDRPVNTLADIDREVLERYLAWYGKYVKGALP